MQGRFFGAQADSGGALPGRGTTPALRFQMLQPVHWSRTRNAAAIADTPGKNIDVCRSATPSLPRAPGQGAIPGEFMPRAAIATILLMLAAAPAFGQGAEIGLTVGWSNFTNNTIGLSQEFADVPSEYTVDDGLRIGSRMAINSGNFIGHEFTYAWQRSKLKILGQEYGGMSIHNIYYNFVLHATPEGSAVRPFITGGAGVSVFNPPGVSSLSGYGDNKFGYNYGAGLKFKVTDTYGVRLDVRDYVTGKPFDLPENGGRLHNLEISAGFSLLF
jgi:opacity protein-like surface antigen